MKNLLNKTIKGGILALTLGVAGLFAAPAQAITIDFSSGVSTFSSGDVVKYVEDDLTVVSQYASSSKHIHLTTTSGSTGKTLRNHANCCSTPYLLTFAMPVNLISVDFKGSSSNTFTSNIGTPAFLPGTGSFQTFLLVNATNPSDWLGISSIVWQQNSGSLYLDNLVYDKVGQPTAPVPEPSTMLLLGSGLAGIVGWRYRKQQA